MRNFLFLSLFAIVSFSSCQKFDQTQTRVGFYVIDPNAPTAQDGAIYNLYIDHQYHGILSATSAETNDAALMNFQVLDSKKHIIEVKKLNTLVSSTYLLIRKREVGTGTAFPTTGHVNGASYKKGTNFSTYAIFQ
jgi:hypothetical protein